MIDLMKKVFFDKNARWKKVGVILFVAIFLIGFMSSSMIGVKAVVDTDGNPPVSTGTFTPTNTIVEMEKMEMILLWDKVCQVPRSQQYCKMAINLQQ